jgi:hypothetical protein
VTLKDFPSAPRSMQKGMKSYDWVLHDTRRTIRSRMSDLPVDSEVAESILAHVPRGMEGVYNSSPYVHKKRVALTLWQDLLFDVIGGASWQQALRDCGLIEKAS